MSNWDKIKELKNKAGDKIYDERFRRMWDFYLRCITGLARSQQSTVGQIVFSHSDIPGGYVSIR